MNLKRAEMITKDLMIHNGVAHYRFMYSHRKLGLGYCSYTRKIISLSKYFVKLNNEEQVIEVALHEIAHAIAPGGHTYYHFKQVCKELGTCSSSVYKGEIKSLPRKYVGVCDKCGKNYFRHKRLFNGTCGICGTTLKWQENTLKIA